MRFFTLVVIALVIGVAAPFASGQAIFEIVKPMQQIPRGTYKTWSLFLVCTPDWIEAEKSTALKYLYHRFNSFGDAIGRDNLAVWFWKRQMEANDSELAENIDIAKSAEFCGAIGRAPSQGPYLVITTEYPDVEAFPPERAIFELGGLQPSELAKLLNNLIDQLVLQGRVDAALAAEHGSFSPDAVAGPPIAPPTPSLWMRILEATRQSLIGLGCNVKLEVNTGLLTAEIRACAG